MPTILDVINKMEILASGDGTGLKAQSTPIKQAFPGVFEARNFSDKKRDKLADQGKARPDGSYPIVNKQDLKNAKRAIGRGGNNPADRAWINKRAKALGEPKIGETNVDAGGAGSGCHGPNCGRHGGGKGTDKTHVPKSATVSNRMAYDHTIHHSKGRDLATLAKERLLKLGYTSSGQGELRENFKHPAGYSANVAPGYGLERVHMNAPLDHHNSLREALGRPAWDKETAQERLATYNRSKGR